MKRLLAVLLSLCILMGSIPMVMASAEDAEASSLSYSFANDFVSNADGVIKYSGELSAEEITAVSLYWADADGIKLADWSAIAETDGASIISGYHITGNKLIPKGAKKILAEISASEISLNITADIPAEKQNADDAIYSMFFVSDSHVNADEINNVYMNHNSMVSRFTELKSLMNTLAESGDNVIGASLIGDVVVGEHTSTGGHGYWVANKEDYDAVNAVMDESGFENAYPLYYINGNHDIIESLNGDGSAWINFLDEKINGYNAAIENNTYAENIMSAIEPIEKESGKYWYDTYIKGYHYIYLSVPYNGFGIYSSEQLSWLDALLKEDAKGDLPTFVIGHYPLSYTHDNSAGHFDNSAELEAVLEKYPNTIYISGHLHYSPETYDNNIIIGNNQTTLVNTGALITYDTDADSNRIYKPNGIYCRVFADRVEFSARILMNLTEETDGYWVSKTANVLTLKNTANPKISAEISADSSAIRNGTTLSALIDGKIADTSAYECKWYIDDTLVGTGATHTLSYYYDEENSLITPNGVISVKITDLSDSTISAWAFYETEAEIYMEISSAEELAKIGVDTSYPLDGNYILTKDIDLSAYENWTPIGDINNIDSTTLSYVNTFTGIFEGNGHTISNLTINWTESVGSNGQLFIGLFAATQGATIRNLVMSNANISAGNGSNQIFVGAIAGGTEASISGVPTTMENISVINSTLTVNSSYNAVGLGSFVGTTNKRFTSRRAGSLKINNCYSNATLLNKKSNSQSCAGGFVGYAYATGTAGLEFKNSIFAGTITCTGATHWSGDVIGKGNSSTNDSPTYYTVTNVYATADIENTPDNGSYTSACATADFDTSAQVSSLGLSEDIWTISDMGAILKISEYVIFYDGYIKISTGVELAKIGVDENYPLDGKYVLTNDIDLSSFDSWTPIGDIAISEDRTSDTPLVFRGIFDGNAHTIKNLTINYSSSNSGYVCLGLFSGTRGADVKNLIFENVNITAGSSSCQYFVGVVSGNAEALKDGTPSVYSNIYITNANLLVTNSYNAVGVGSFAGGTNKRNSSSYSAGLRLENCYSDANITNRKSNGQSCAGGLVGYGYGTKGDDSALEFENCVFAGTVTCTGASHWCGSIAGRVVASTLYTVNNVYTTSTIANSSSTDSYNVITGADYDSTADITTLGFDTKYWYNTPLGARHRLNLIKGDIDGNSTIDAYDLAYLRQYLLGADISVDSIAADANGDNSNTILDLIRIKKNLAQ